MSEEQTTAIMQAESTALAAPITEQMLRDFLFGQGTKLTEAEQNTFFNIALRNNLDPWKREIFAIKYGNEFNVVTGYNVYLSRADATGLLNGWKVEAVKNQHGDLVGAKATIYRKDFDEPVEWEITRDEFDKKRSTWKQMPEFMIKKVCMAQAFRLAFPAAMAGLPYLEQEVVGMKNITPDKEPPVLPKRKSEATAEPADPDKVTEAQRKMLWAVVRENNLTEEDFREFLVSQYDITSTKDIPFSAVDEIKQWLESSCDASDI